VQIVLWMAFHDRIQCGIQLKKRKWSGPVQCKICGQMQTTDHILFQCPIASYLWTFFRVVLCWPCSPTSVEGLFAEVGGQCRGSKSVSFFFFVQELFGHCGRQGSMQFLTTRCQDPEVSNGDPQDHMLLKTCRPSLKPRT
jgi:hypothetical protein